MIGSKPNKRNRKSNTKRWTKPIEKKPKEEPAVELFEQESEATFYEVERILSHKVDKRKN